MAGCAVEVSILNLSFLLEKKLSWMGGTITLMTRVHSEISEIKLELESMRSFVRDAERYKDQIHRLSVWLAQNSPPRRALLSYRTATKLKKIKAIAERRDMIWVISKKVQLQAQITVPAGWRIWGSVPSSLRVTML
ncbi:unnamed protein product [Ilex paraguariensis]|uniref:Disease resistance N-terminal domain-containing protein n=1 Tax=Ilex paraguariensis TaxID=185542 RepID=A0ABC8U3H5_9AQUA